MNIKQQHQIRALSRKIMKAIDGKPIGIAGAALATVVGLVCLDLAGDDEGVALGGVDAMLGDARLFVQSAHSHKGTAQ